MKPDFLYVRKLDATSDNPFSSRTSSEKSKPSELEIAREFFKRLEQPAQQILELLRPNIDALKYDSILGDDADARIHTLVLSHAIQELYADRKKLQTVFVQGGSTLHSKKPLEQIVSDRQLTDALRKKIQSGEVVNIEDDEASAEDSEEHPKEKTKALYRWKESTTHREEVQAYLHRMKPLLGSRALLVTEEVYTGSSIDVLIEALHSIGVEVDAVSFGVAESEGLTDNILETPNGNSILLGSYRHRPWIPETYVGVYSRGRSGLGHAIKQTHDDEGRPIQTRINASRKVAKELGHLLAQKYHQPKKRKEPPAQP